MKEKSILEMVGGEKYLNPHYNIKAEKMTKEELKDEMKNRISLALKDPILQQGFEIICKENAELKEQNKKLLESCEGATMMYEDLCKAKKIIKELLDFDFLPEVEIKKQAEQFLNDSKQDG